MRVVDDYFDWEGDRHLRRPLSDTVIYEMHVKGFTKSKSADVKTPWHVLGRDREDPVPQVAGRHGCGIDASSRVPDFRYPRQ